MAGSTSSIILNNRKSLNLTGVKDIGKFDDHDVIVMTNQGDLKISGNNLKIGKLCIESGQLELSGTIDSMSYVDSKKISSNFLKKLFS